MPEAECSQRGRPARAQPAEVPCRLAGLRLRAGHWELRPALRAAAPRLHRREPHPDASRCSGSGQVARSLRALRLQERERESETRTWEKTGIGAFGFAMVGEPRPDAMAAAG